MHISIPYCTGTDILFLFLMQVMFYSVSLVLSCSIQFNFPGRGLHTVVSEQVSGGDVVFSQYTQQIFHNTSQGYSSRRIATTLQREGGRMSELLGCSKVSLLFPQDWEHLGTSHLNAAHVEKSLGSWRTKK